jgi:periplasmic protein TonB
MFEHYLKHQAPDSRRRWRIAIALNVAGFTTLGMVAFTWLADKMMIAQVDPPSAHYVMVQMDMEALPPPPAPPAAPAVKPPDADEPPDEDPIAPPVDIDEVIPKVKPRTAVRVVGNGTPDSTGTTPIGVPGKIPGIPGGTPGLIPSIGTAVVSDRKPTETRAPLPISAVMAQAIYTPPPDQERLSATRAAMFDKRPGENETSFCIDVDGRTVDVRTTRKFPGDPKVDEICRETIKTWRFKSFKVDGRPVKTCSVQVFNIKFRDQ